jgi:hypothetical protein
MSCLRVCALDGLPYEQIGDVLPLRQASKECLQCSASIAYTIGMHAQGGGESLLTVYQTDKASSLLRVAD